MNAPTTRYLLVLLLISVLTIGIAFYLSGASESLAMIPEGEARTESQGSITGGRGSESLGTSREVIALAPSEEGDPKAIGAQLVGRLVDSAGNGLTGLMVNSHPEEGSAAVQSGEGGRFTLPYGGQRMELRVTEDGWATLASSLVEAGSGEGRVEPLLIAAPAIEVSGTVRDQFGNGIPGVDLRFRLPKGFAAAFPLSLDASTLRDEVWRVRTDPDGRYHLQGVAALSGASLFASKSNYLPASRKIPLRSEADMDFVLEQPRSDADTVLGQVLDLAGYPVAAALVCLGTSGALSDAEGRFSLSRKDSRRVQTVRAMKRGWLPARASLPELADGEMTPFIYLRLAGPPLSIRGRVLDARGRALAGLRVWALSPEQFPGSPGHVSHVEAFLSGGMTDDELRRRFTRNGELSADMGDLRVQNPTSFWGWVETDADGRFELAGLQRRDYELRILRMSNLQMQDVGPYPAGSEAVEILFDPETSPVIAGRILSEDGSPVEGVSVQANCVPIRSRFEWPDGSSQNNSEPTHDGPIQRSDVEGRFRFTDLGAKEIYLTMRGDHIMVALLGLGEGGLQAAGAGDLDDLRITVVRRMQIRVSLSLPDLADSFAVLDAADEPLEIVSYEGGGMASSRRWRLSDSGSPVLAVSEQARVVQLYRDGQVLRRIPLRLVFGKVNEIDV